MGELFDGPGGNKQWRIPGTQGEKLRLTSDIALLHDANYTAIVHEFAGDMAAFNQAFDKAWFDLTTTNVGGKWSLDAKCDDGSTPTVRRLQTAMRGDDPFVTGAASSVYFYYLPLCLHWQVRPAMWAIDHLF